MAPTCAKFESPYARFVDYSSITRPWFAQPWSESRHGSRPSAYRRAISMACCWLICAPGTSANIQISFGPKAFRHDLAGLRIDPTMQVAADASFVRDDRVRSDPQGHRSRYDRSICVLTPAAASAGYSECQLPRPLRRMRGQWSGLSLCLISFP